MDANSAALIWLVAQAAVSGIYLVYLYQRSPYTFWESCLYVPAYLMGRLQWRVTFLNAPPPEMRRGAILAANHRSSFDPFFVQLAAGRRVHWMVAREYCEHPVFGIILRVLQVIPTNRSGLDSSATKRAIRLAQEGRLVGMFPEGQLNHTRDPLVPIRSGAALVAIKAEVPLIPLWIDGSPYRREVWSPLFMRARVRVTFGVPIWARSEPSSESADAPREGSDTGSATAVYCRPDPDEMILAWARQILALAGHPEFRVQLARRHRRRHRG